MKVYLREPEACVLNKNDVPISWHYDCYLVDYDSTKTYQFLSRKKFKTAREVHQHIDSTEFISKIRTAIGRS